MKEQRLKKEQRSKKEQSLLKKGQLDVEKFEEVGVHTLQTDMNMEPS